jgi:Transcriptional regulator
MSITIKKGKVSRTQKCIIDALLKLMEKDNFEEITITQIAQEAEIARRTFYLNYNTKSEVLASYIKFLYDDFAEETQNDKERTWKSDVINFFLYWSRHSDILLLLEKSNQFLILLNEFENILSNSNVFDFSSLIKDELPVKRKEYIVVTVAAGLWRILEKWVQNSFVESAEEIAEIFLSI